MTLATEESGNRCPWPPVLAAVIKDEIKDKDETIETHGAENPNKYDDWFLLSTREQLIRNQQVSSSNLLVGSRITYKSHQEVWWLFSTGGVWGELSPRGPSAPNRRSISTTILIDRSLHFSTLAKDKTLRG
jgi:hypothetical protein